jgi:hypothetical protein
VFKNSVISPELPAIGKGFDKAETSDELCKSTEGYFSGQHKTALRDVPGSMTKKRFVFSTNSCPDK